MSSNSIIGSAFGSTHRWWMINPKKAALVGLACYLLLVGSAVSLQIWSKFSYKAPPHCIVVAPPPIAPAGVGSTTTSQLTAEPAVADGFSVWNWGVLYSFALPLAAFLMALYFRTLDRALLSLDDVIKPVGNSKKPFTAFLGERVRTQWSSVVFPISFLLSIILTILADGHDIVAPLQSSVIWPTCTRDWSTVGYTQGHFSPIWYFAFNCAAFALQAFLGYCGILLLTLTAVVFGSVFTYGLGGRDIVETFRQPGTEPSPERYHPEWIWGDVRCGLRPLDTVFLMFTGLSFFTLVACATSIFVNVYLRHHATRGSVILAVGTMFFIPWSAFWIFVPYFTNFPRKLPDDFKPKKNRLNDAPDPWPFGSEKMAWTLIGLTALFWMSLLGSLLTSLFGIQKP